MARHETVHRLVRGRAELAGWERIDQLRAAAASGTVYDPDTDDVVQAELAADAAAAAARETELRELGTLEQTEPREGDEAIRDELTRRAGGYIQADVDAWLAHALAAHYRAPDARERAAALLTPPLLAHAALLIAAPWHQPHETEHLAAARCPRAAPGAARAARLLYGGSEGSAAFARPSRRTGAARAAGAAIARCTSRWLFWRTRTTRFSQCYRLEEGAAPGGMLLANSGPSVDRFVPSGVHPAGRSAARWEVR
ncbi:hypothetical protein ACFU8Q_40660, partial [Streptomyces sp. NPDC057543]|uniref:hypothetical protein n=1 Tax=Streptomyces sp. NPDC057543 TaxID=3346163 RepID=UPI0036ACE51A